MCDKIVASKRPALLRRAILCVYESLVLCAVQSLVLISAGVQKYLKPTGPGIEWVSDIFMGALFLHT